MDIEELNKTQIILLVLLVSFVTSIATGIVTVSLLAQAPPAITQTVNRIVERTVETVVPNTNNQQTQTVKETTVVVKEDDLITESIASSIKKTGRVYGGTSTSTPVAGLATQIGQNMLVTDSSIVSKDHLVSIGDTLAVFTVSQEFPEVGIAILVPKATSTTLGSPFRVGDVGAMKLGQTVTALVSVLSERVAIGAVAARYILVNFEQKGIDPISIRAIDTNIDASLVPGAPLVNIFGDLVGVSTGVSVSTGGQGAFVSASDISALLSATRATSTPAN